MDHDQSEAQWREKLTSEEYRVLRERGTEPPFSGAYVDEKRPGMYTCRACGATLFSSTDKYDSGSGWPSFTRPASGNDTGTQTVTTRPDSSHGMERTEVLCTNCGSHLGHVFTDGPREQGGLRYCINSVCLDLQPKDQGGMLPS